MLFFTEAITDSYPNCVRKSMRGETDSNWSAASCLKHMAGHILGQNRTQEDGAPKERAGKGGAGQDRARQNVVELCRIWWGRAGQSRVG